MLYVGVDAHKSTSYSHERGRSDPPPKTCPQHKPRFQRGARRIPTNVEAVLEASYSWGPMYDWLDELSEEVVLAHPLKVRAIASA